MAGLDGKVIMVTGASRGIGLAIARRLASEGARLVMVARHQQTLNRAKAQVVGELLLVQADVTRPREVARMFRRVGREFGRLDVLVKNAGGFTYKPFLRTTLADWRLNLETNLTSLFLVTRAALPWLAKSRAAHVVNILSVSSRLAFPNCSAYTASKFGALGLTRVLVDELRPRKIRVTAILPGSTNTRLTDEFDFAVRRAELIHNPKTWLKPSSAPCSSRPEPRSKKSGLAPHAAPSDAGQKIARIAAENGGVWNRPP